MKKLLTALAVCFCACAFTACADTSEPSGKSGGVVLNVQSVVFVADGEFMTLTGNTSVKDYMDALADNGELVFSGKDGDFGFYIESVYGTKAEGNAFWAVYTDLVKLEGDDTVYSNEEYGTFAYGNKILYSASYGVSGLPCADGYTYALVYTTY